MVLNDKFVCGDCTDAPNFTRIDEFLAHKIGRACQKSNHVACPQPEDYNCQLCLQRFSRKSPLLMHYSLYHKVHSISECSCCHDSASATKSGKCMLRPRKGILRRPKQKRKRRAAGLSAQSIPTVSGDGSVEVINNPNVGGEMQTTSIDSDFYFILKDEKITNASIPYTKRFLVCIYCTYKSTTILKLNSHMHQAHADILKLPVESQPQVLHAGCDILRAHEYIEKTTPLPPTSAITSLSQEDSPSASYWCEFCFKLFTNKTYLKKHREKQHIAPQLYQCDLCDHTETAKHRLRAHREKHLVKEFQCKECDFVSSTKVAIQNHIQVHRTGSHICDVCGKAYKLKDTLKKHKRVHDKSRPFACNVDGCTLRFKTERMCKGHLKTHYRSAGNFPCAECGYSFRRKHHLKRHLENTHNLTLVVAEASSALEPIETFEIPASPSNSAMVAKPSEPAADSTFNLRDIVLEGDTFHLSTDQQVNQQNAIIIVKPTNNRAVLYQPETGPPQTVYSTEHRQHPVYETQDADITQEVTSTEHSHAVLEDGQTVPYCLEGSCDQTVVTSENPTVVEFIVDSNADGVVFEASHEQEPADTLFT